MYRKANARFGRSVNMSEVSFWKCFPKAREDHRVCDFSTERDLRQAEFARLGRHQNLTPQRGSGGKGGTTLRGEFVEGPRQVARILWDEQTTSVRPSLQQYLNASETADIVKQS